MKTEVMSFRQTILANTQQEFKERMKGEGRIEEIRIRFYSGQQLDLLVRPYALLTGNRAEDFFTYPDGTQNYIAGDDDYFVFPVALELGIDDEVRVWANNTDLANAYTLSCDIVVSYFGGDVNE